MSDSITRLYHDVLDCRFDDPSTSRTARLLRSGRSKMAKKLAEEAVEVVIDAMHGDREAVVKESADLIYNLVVLWIASGIKPEDVWKEMDRRERLFGIADPTGPVIGENEIDEEAVEDELEEDMLTLEDDAEIGADLGEEPAGDIDLDGEEDAEEAP